jgi:hypothetical protein
MAASGTSHEASCGEISEGGTHLAVQIPSPNDYQETNLLA